MAYCTQADIEKRIGSDRLVSFADHDEDGTADADVVAAAIADAQAHVDSYLGEVYEVPVSPVPDVLRKRTSWMAVYFLALGRDSVTDPLQKHVDMINEWLEGIAAGKVSLGDADPTEATGAPGVRYDVDDRHFKRSNFL